MAPNMAPRRSLAWQLAATLAALGALDAAAQQLGDCDPLVPDPCYLPFPNNFWLRLNATTNRTQLALSRSTFPANALGVRLDPAAGGWNELDGFAPAMPIMTFWDPSGGFGVDLDASQTPRLWNVSASLAPECPTALLDTETGELLPHWTELDARSESIDGPHSRRLFMLWPVAALNNSRRYIVAMRGLVNAQGAALPPSQAFLELRDNISSSDPNVELRRALFADIFARLEAVGFVRASLQLAWDFTVASTDAVHGRALFMRDDAFSRLPPDGPDYAVTSVQENVSIFVARVVQGVVRVPLYLSSTAPNSTLVIGPDGMPVFQGFANVTFTVVVPASLAQQPQDGEGAVLQYGHGLFGDQSEVLTDYLQNVSWSYKYVMVAVDWWGLDQDDVKDVAEMLFEDPTNFRIVPDRLTQAQVNALTSMRLLLGKFAKDPAMTFNGQPVVSPSSPRFYYGNSLGGIMGSVYMALSTDVTRGVLGVAGGPFPLLLPRSVDFDSLWDGLALLYADPLDRVALLGVVELLWCRLEPGGYANFIVNNPLPGTPAHEVLMQYALGDAQVSYLGTYTIARSMGAHMFASQLRVGNETLFGFPAVPDDAPASGAVAVGWDFPGVPPPPEDDTPPNKQTDTHEDTRRQLTAMEMMAGFFASGQVLNTCGGPCHGIKPSQL
jgi:hypothetical protein